MRPATCPLLCLVLSTAISCGGEVVQSITGGTTTSTGTSSTTGATAGPSGTGGSIGGVGGAGGAGGLGAGGQPPSCGSFTLAGSVFSFDDPGADDVQPSLVDLAGKANVVFLRQATASASQVVQVGSFTAWGAWPPPDLAVSDTQPLAQSFVPTMPTSILATAPNGPHFSANLSLLSNACWVPSLSPLGAAPGSSCTVSGTPVMLAADGTTSAVIGGLSQGDATNGYSLGVVATAPASLPLLTTVGCSTMPVAAAATTAPGGGWMIGAALSGPPDFTGASCAPASGAVRTVYTNTLDASGHVGPINASPEWLGPDSIGRVRMAPRSDGAWAVYGITDGQNIVFERLDAGGAFAAGATITTGWDTMGFDIQAMGDTVVFATGDQASLLFEAFDGSGNLGFPSWEAGLTTDGQVNGPVSMLASPHQSSFLVAWSESVMGSAGQQLRFARYDCSP